MCTHTLKGVRKLKGLRLILVNSQIFNFFMNFVTIVVKTIKYKLECYILNLLLLFQLKIIFYIGFIKISKKIHLNINN